MIISFESLEEVSRIRQERIETGELIRASYNTYCSPNLSGPSGRSSERSDRTAKSMYHREDMIIRYNRMLEIECECWQAVNQIHDREIRQLIVKTFMLGNKPSKALLSKSKERISEYLKTVPEQLN